MKCSLKYQMGDCDTSPKVIEEVDSKIQGDTTSQEDERTEFLDAIENCRYEFHIRLLSTMNVMETINNEFIILRDSCKEIQNDIAREVSNLKKRRRSTLLSIENLK